MPSIELLNQKGQNVGTLDLADDIFAIEEHQQAVFDTIIAELAGRRQGTQKAKTRHEVRGGGRKPWRQKGTGRARQGSIRSPQWIKGGVVFAPKSRDFSKKMNVKAKEVALFSALSQKIRDDEVIFIEKLEAEGRIIVIRPERPVEVGRMEKDTGKLSALYQEGYEIASKMISDSVITR